MIIDKRSSGVLLHITSLPSPYGIGDLGPEAYKFADQLAAAGQRYWQILPLNPTETGMGNSPYSSHSAFAGNPLLLSPDLLIEDGLVAPKDLETKLTFDDAKVDYEKVTKYKKGIWMRAYVNYKSNPSPDLIKEFKAFRKEHQAWLQDYSHYVAFKEHFEEKSWVDWDKGIKNRDEKAIQELETQLADAIEREEFLQFLFYRQWEKLKAYCNSKDVHFFGDMPFYVSHDSADVWANPKDFKLDKEGNPTAVSGVPPDFFSETGQLWGTPVFNWKELEKNKYDWWLLRIGHNLKLFDLLRLDHFRALSAYWEVPSGEETAMNGKWVKSPGSDILSLVKKKFPDMPIIAEDLGEIDQPVRDLMQEFDLPGMRLLIFAFEDELAFESSFLPHNHIDNCIVYTGTHDNATARAWFESVKAENRKRMAAYTNQEVTKENVHEIMGRMAYQSVAVLAVLPLQDILGLGKEAIMNKPSTGNGNWEWRLKSDQFTKEKAQELRKLMELYDRV